MTYQEIQAQTGRHFARRAWLESAQKDRAVKVSDSGSCLYRKTSRNRVIPAVLAMHDKSASDWVEVEGL